MKLKLFSFLSIRILNCGENHKSTSIIISSNNFMHQNSKNTCFCTYIFIKLPAPIIFFYLIKNLFHQLDIILPIGDFPYKNNHSGSNSYNPAIFYKSIMAYSCETNNRRIYFFRKIIMIML